MARDGTGFDLIGGVLPPAANGALNAAKYATRVPRQTPNFLPSEPIGTPSPAVNPADSLVSDAIKAGSDQASKGFLDSAADALSIILSEFGRGVSLPFVVGPEAVCQQAAIDHQYDISNSPMCAPVESN